MNHQLDTPVAMMIFNRPWTTKVVFERIRQARPRILMVIADGPRQSRTNEAALCRESRRVAEQVDWPCEVLKNYSDTNLGCGVRMASGIDWVFSNVEEAIILEDDCVPDHSFFPFCEELLEHYRDVPRIMHISGANVLFGKRFTADSYYFSRYPHCWGWASWRRAWRHFDFDMRAWESNPPACLACFKSDKEREYWKSAWDSLARGELNAWSHRWCLACLKAEGLAVTPSVNMVNNVGFGGDATHTTSRLAAIRSAVVPIEFPLRHPPGLTRNCAADMFTARRVFFRRSFAGKAIEIVRRRSLAAFSHMRGKRIGQLGDAEFLPARCE